MPIHLCNAHATIVPFPHKCAQRLHDATTINRLCPNNVVLCLVIVPMSTVRLDQRIHLARELIWETLGLAYLTKFVQLRLLMPNSPMASLVFAQECPTNVICLHEANRFSMSTLLQCLCVQQPKTRRSCKTLVFPGLHLRSLAKPSPTRYN